MNLGDLVRLKSGGPIMTVETVNENSVWCVWFDKAEFKKEYIAKGALVIVEDGMIKRAV